MRPLETRSHKHFSDISVLETVVKHFGAHQSKVLENDEGRNNSNGRSTQRSFLLSSRNIESTQQSVVEARVQLLLRDLKALCSSNSKENDSISRRSRISIDVNELDSKHKQELIDAILKCLDKAISDLAQSTRDSNDITLGANSILELAAAFGTFTLLRKKSNDNEWLISPSGAATVADAIFQRAELATKTSDDMIRVAGCRLFGFCLKALGKIIVMIPNHENLRTDHENPQKKIIDLCNVAANCLISRCTDKSQKVRNVAIQVSRYAFLTKQDVDQHKNLVNPEEYVFYSGELEGCLANAMTNDSSHLNRAAAVSALPINEESLLLIIDRVRDVNVKVREEALSVLKGRVPSSALSEEQKVHILRSGITARCEVTHYATMGLLCCKWLKETRFQPYDLMEMLDPTSNDDIVEKVALELTNLADGSSSKMMFPELSTNEIDELRANLEFPLQKDISSLSLTPSLALYIRVRVSASLNSSFGDNFVSKVVPDMVSLSTTLQKHLGKYLKSVERMVNSADAVEEDGGDNDDSSAIIEEEDNIQKEESYICSEILRLSEICQTSCGDEAGRRQMTALICNILCSSNGDDNLVEPCVRTLAALSGSEQVFFEIMTENLREIEAGGTISCDGDNSTSPPDLEGQDEEECEESRQLRWLSVLSTMLEHTTIKRSKSEQSATTTLLKPFLPYIEESMSNASEFVRQAAVSCLTRYLIACGGSSTTDDTSASIANDGIVHHPFELLVTIAKEERETLEVRAQALLGLCDLHAVASSSSSFVEDQGHNMEQHRTDYLQILSQLMGTDNELKMIASECCAKSYLSTSIQDDEVLARLIVNYFEIGADMVAGGSECEATNVTDIGNPARLQQLLSLFFPSFCMRGHGYRILLARSVKPLLELTTLKANKQLHKLPVLKMFDYVMSIIEMAHEAAVTESGEEEKSETKEENSINGQQQSAVLLEYLVVALLFITEILLESRQNMSKTTMRALCKKLGTKAIPLSDLMLSWKEIRAEEHAQIQESNSVTTIAELLEKLLENVEELVNVIDDHYAEGPLEELEAVMTQ